MKNPSAPREKGVARPPATPGGKTSQDKVETPSRKPKARKDPKQKHSSRKTRKAKAAQKPLSPVDTKDPLYSTVVISSQRPELMLNSPRSSDVLDRTKIRRLAQRTTPELLTDVPGVLVQKTNHGGGSPFIRGFTGQHVLFLVDGIRVNNGTTRYGPNQALNTIDPFTIARIELLRGPGSVLYGSDAVGGVIQILTRDPPFTPYGPLRWGATATMRLGSADRSQSYNIGGWTQVGRVAGFVGGSIKDFNTLVGGRGIDRQPWTGYQEGDWDGAVKILLTGSWLLKVATTGVRQFDVPRTDKCSDTDFRYFTHQYRDLVYAKLTGSSGAYLDRFEATVSYQSQRELRNRYRLLRDRIETELDKVNTVGLGLVAGTNLGRYSRLTYGLDLYNDWVASSAHREAISSGELTPMGTSFRGRFVDGSTYLTSGIFLSDRIAPIRWLLIDVGGRLALTRASIPFDSFAAGLGLDGGKMSKTFVGPVGGGSITFIPFRFLRIITSIQQGFRAPNLDDYSHLGSEGAGFDIPSPGIKKAERSTTMEMGVKAAYRFVSAWAFGHYTVLRNFIARRFTGSDIDGEPTTERVNAARGYMAGIEALVAVRFPKGFSANAWISYTRGELEDPLNEPHTQPMTRVPPLMGAVTVEYTSRKGYYAFASLKLAARQDRLSTSDKNDKRICPDGPDGCLGTPGFAVVSLGGSVPLGRYVDLLLRIENITNEAYKYHGSGAYAPGLSAVGQLRVRY